MSAPRTLPATLLCPATCSPLATLPMVPHRLGAFSEIATAIALAAEPPSIAVAAAVNLALAVALALALGLAVSLYRRRRAAVAAELPSPSPSAFAVAARRTACGAALGSRRVWPPGRVSPTARAQQPVRAHCSLGLGVRWPVPTAVAVVWLRPDVSCVSADLASYFEIMSICIMITYTPLAATSHKTSTDTTAPGGIRTCMIMLALRSTLD